MFDFLEKGIIFEALKEARLKVTFKNRHFVKARFFKMPPNDSFENKTFWNVLIFFTPDADIRSVRPNNYTYTYMEKENK